MNKIIIALLVSIPLLLATGSASAEEKQPKPQHVKMKSCNATAKEKALKGAERKEFMKECLKKKPA